MKYYWFSFSYEGKNNGVCIVQEKTPEKALQKTINMEIHPPHDDIKCFLLDDFKNQGHGMVGDRLYSSKEMKELKFKFKQITTN